MRNGSAEECEFRMAGKHGAEEKGADEHRRLSAVYYTDLISFVCVHCFGQERGGRLAETLARLFLEEYNR